MSGLAADLLILYGAVLMGGGVLIVSGVMRLYHGGKRW